MSAGTAVLVVLLSIVQAAQIRYIVHYFFLHLQYQYANGEWLLYCTIAINSARLGVWPKLRSRHVRYSFSIADIHFTSICVASLVFWAPYYDHTSTCYYTTVIG